MKLTKLFTEFFENEKVSGIILILCTIISLGISNSVFGADYQHFWHSDFAGHSVEFWINDGLMAIFFLLIGLELEREIYQGELSNFKDALLPIFGAIGGMIIPAAIFLYFNYGTATQSGAGIPMATDILIIAIFYTQNLLWTNLFIALGIFVFLFVLGKYFKVRNLIIYLIGGVFMWYFMLNSGVHATVTGVLLAFAIPFGKGEENSTSYVLQHFLHKPVAFIILPVFALANTAIVLSSDIGTTLSQNYSLGIALGLIVGKPLGIFVLTFFAVKVGLCKLPDDLNWKSILGVGFLAGIGFTMSIFIALLAFDSALIINNAKFIILISSLIAGVLGFLFLKFNLKPNRLREN